MPLVFIHGVNTRNSASYERAKRLRAELFTRFLGPRLAVSGGAVQVLEPYWGDHGAALAWQSASLPAELHEALGADIDLSALLLKEIAPDSSFGGQAVLLNAARVSLASAIDALWIAAADSANEADLSVLASFATTAAEYAAAKNEHEPEMQWLDQVHDDHAFALRLEDEVASWSTLHALTVPEAGIESLGVAESIQQFLQRGVQRLQDGAADLAGRNIVTPLRSSIQKKISIFIGDVFVYLANRSDSEARSSAITNTILESLRQAHSLRTAQDPYVTVVGHSMGGVIAYDILSSTLSKESGFYIDNFITVGSQVGLFEEMKLYHSSSHIYSSAQNNKVPPLSIINKWINIYDRMDVLSFSASAIFDQAEDYEFVTGKGLLSAHSSYFFRPSFYERLRERLKAPGLL